MLRKVLTLAACLTLMGFAGINPTEADTNRRPKINSVPSMPSSMTEERQVRGHAYTDLVDGIAMIVQIDNKMIYFSGDLGYPLATKVDYFDIKGRRTSRSFFKVGQPAAYKLDQDRHVESLWEVKERNANP